MNKSTNPFVDALDKMRECAVKYRFSIVIAIVSVAIVGGSLVGYRYYQKMSSVNAHKDFAAAVTLFEAQEKNAQGADKEQWESLAKTFESGYEKNSSARLAPAFLAYQADALLKAGKFDAALPLLRKAADLMAVAAIKESYELKLDLVLLDSGKEEFEKEGLSRLQKLAAQGNSTVHAQALYHLGYFFWIKKNFEEAKNYWQQFMIKYSTEQGTAELTSQVKAMLELLAV